jgi:hypothetical protein
MAEVPIYRRVTHNNILDLLAEGFLEGVAVPPRSESASTCWSLGRNAGSSHALTCSTGMLRTKLYRRGYQDQICRSKTALERDLLPVLEIWWLVDNCSET